MAKAQKGILDDSYQKLNLTDFSGGLNTYIGALSLSPNQSPDCLNVIPFPGRLQYRGGWTLFSSLTTGDPCDFLYPFYDSTGAKHLVSWEDGSVYDYISGSAVLVEAGAYTEGQKIGAVDLNGVLYWSTVNVPLRFWNPVAATHGAVAQSGASPPPAASYLCLYTNAIVAFNVTFGAGAQQPNVFAWSAINDPTNWTAANAQAVGPNNSIPLQFGLQFGIAEIGVSPFRTLIVGRGDKGIYGYQGALGSLSEFVVNLPAGCKDGYSAQYIPGADQFGNVIFLATDTQIWATNGVTASPVSLPVLPTLTAQVSTALVGNANARFFSGYNNTFQYSWCDINGVQYVYKWDLKAWSNFTGWPSGPVASSTDGSGVPVLYVGANSSSPKVIGIVGVPQTGDNGAAPSIYWKTPFLSMGDPGTYKEFNWVDIYVYDTGTNYGVNGATMPRPDGTFRTASTLVFNTPSSASNLFILGLSTLNGPNVLGSGATTALGTGTPFVYHGRLSCPATGSGILAGLTGLTEQLAGNAGQIKVAYNSGTIDFELTGIQLRFKSRGSLRDGGLKFNPEAGVTQVFDPYNGNVVT